MRWLELTVFFWGLWNPVAGFEHIYQKGKAMNSAFLSWNMIKVTYIYVGQQMARCLPKTPVCQCIKSRGHFCLYVLWYLIFEMPPIKPHQQVCKALKEPCWSCKGKWSVVCTSAALRMQIGLYVYTQSNGLQLHNHVYLCEKLLPYPVQEVQSLQWKRWQPGLLYFAGEAGRYAANDDENCRERMVTQLEYSKIAHSSSTEFLFADSSFM